MPFIEAEGPTGKEVILKADSNGYLYVNSGGGGGGTEGDAAPSSATPVMAEARGSDKTAVDEGDAVRIVSDLQGKLALAGYVFADNATRLNEVNPESERYIGSTPVDVTNETDGTYYYYFDMAGYRHLSLQWSATDGSGSPGVTLTIEGSVQDDGTAAASATYVDVSSLWGSAGGWNSTANATHVASDPSGEGANFKYLRLKAVFNTGGSNDADLTVFAKRWN